MREEKRRRIEIYASVNHYKLCCEKKEIDDRRDCVNATRRNCTSRLHAISVINRVIRLRHVRLMITLSYYGKFNLSNCKVDFAR
jgi:hypothetical protein